MTTTDRRFAPGEGLIRMTTSLRSEGEGDGTTLIGYAAVFNAWAEINSWEGHFRERIAPGAFTKTLQEGGDRIRLFFNHGMDPVIADKPLGKPDVLKEDAKGLYVECRLDSTTYNEDMKASLRSGALDGMSFRMGIVRETWDKIDSDMPERTIYEVRLFEVSLVTYPAYFATQAGLRAHNPAAFEVFEAGGGAGKVLASRSSGGDVSARVRRRYAAFRVRLAVDEARVKVPAMEAFERVKARGGGGGGADLVRHVNSKAGRRERLQLEVSGPGSRRVAEAVGR